MDVTGLVFFLVAVFVVVLWAVSFVMLNKHQGKKGLKRFFIFFGCTILIEAALFITIVVPTFDCMGWFCGLYEFLVFLIISGLILFILPIVMIIMAVRNRKIENESEIIDRTSGF